MEKWMRIISIFFMMLVFWGPISSPSLLAEQGGDQQVIEKSDKDEKKTTASGGKERESEKDDDQEGAGEGEGKRNRFEQLELFNKIMYLIENQYYRDVDSEK